MSCPPRVTAWTRIIQTHVPHWSTPHATVLAVGSLGRVRARSGALTAGRACLATWRGRTEPAVRPQGRAFGAAAATRGTHRCALAVEPGVVPRLAWGVDQWAGTPVALALAAPTWGRRGTGLALRGVSRGGARPGAWTGLAAPAQQAWRREWRRRRPGRQAGPRAWPVRGLADRGLEARWRFRRLPRLGWHPCLRLTTGGTWRPKGQGRGVALQTLGPQPGTTWQGTGSACTGRPRQRHGPLLACGEPGDQAPWLLLTDVPPESRTAGWAGVRAWIAQGCTSTQRAGGPGQRPHLTTPDRAARRWLAVAVAPWWGLSVGGEAAATIPASPVPALTTLGPRPPRRRRATCLRLVRVLRRGWHRLLVALLEPAPRSSPNPGQPWWRWRSRPCPCRVWRCPWPPETSGDRSARDMREDKNMGIMTTLKKPTAERGQGGGEDQGCA